MNILQQAIEMTEPVKTETHSRTQNDLYNEFMQHYSKREGYRYRDYVYDIWKRMIEDYEMRKWHLIRLPHHAKAPYAGSEGANEKALPYDLALKYALDGDNIAVVMMEKLVLIDCDTPNCDGLKNMIMQTRTCRTPRGWAFYTRTPFNARLFARLKKRYPFLDNPRTNIMYGLLPISCAYIEIKRVRVPGLAPRLYEWMNLYDPISFDSFVKRAVTY